MSKVRTKYPELAKAVGKETHLRLVWKDWKKEQPPSGQEVYVIVKFRQGYMPMYGTYWDVTLPGSENGTFGPSRWRSIKFYQLACNELFLDNPRDAKRLVAWANVERMGKLLQICRGS